MSFPRVKGKDDREILKKDKSIFEEKKNLTYFPKLNKKTTKPKNQTGLGRYMGFTFVLEKSH